MKKLLTITITCLLIFSVLAIHAQTANLSIQGVLRNANGTAVENGKYDLIFRLYTDTSPDTLVWQETMNGVDVEGGIYSVILGAGSQALDAKFDRPYTLGVSVEGGTELIPRTKLTSSPYALSLIGDDNIFPNSGNVGVGAASPQHKLTVARGGNVLGLDVDSTGSNNSQIISKSDGLKFSTTEDGYYFEGDITEVMRIKKDGNVGIGIEDPATTLHLKSNGDILRLQGDDHAYLSFYKNGGTNRSGYLGYNGVTDTMALTNEVGLFNLSGNSVDVHGDLGVNINGGAGSVSIPSATEITREGEALKLIGNTNTELGFYPAGLAGGKKAGIGIGETNQLLINSTNSDIILSPASGERVETKGMLYANSHESVYVGQHDHIYERYTSSSYATRQNARYYNLSIYATQGVRANFFVVASDKRIKKDFRKSDGGKDLSTLSKIEVTDYRHIDEVANGKEMRKGVIAQQVETVFPEAITKGTSFVPSVFDFPVSLSFENDNLRVLLKKDHDFVDGDKIRIGTLSGNHEVIVSEVLSSKEFMVNNWQGSTKKDEFFVYGKEVDDFHTVDYDRIFTLNVSATQELARKVAMLEKENAQLKSNNTTLENSNNDLKTEIQTINKRMDDIEQILNLTGSN